jgi:hypothetical protein
MSVQCHRIDEKSSPEMIIAIAAADPSTPYGAAVAAARAAEVVQPEPSAHERVHVLESQLAALEDRLDTAVDAARRGDIAAASAVNLAELTERISVAQKELENARSAVAEAEAVERRRKREENEKSFWNSVETARIARAEFQRAFRDAAISLGKYCQHTEEAIQFSNALRSIFPSSERDNAIADLATVQSLSPLNALLDAGFKPTLGYGYNINISIPVLRKE